MVIKQVADKRVGKPVLRLGPSWRVRCDLEFCDAKVALAFKRIVEAFSTSATKRGNNGKNLG